MSNNRTIFGVILFGGTIGGSLNRDARLIRELVRRNYEVHIFWAKDRTRDMDLDHPNIFHHWLFHGGRYGSPLGDIKALRGINEVIGRLIDAIIPVKIRKQFLGKHPKTIERLIYAWVKLTCNGVEQDKVAVQRFARKLTKHRITHVLPILSLYCPWVIAAREYVQHHVSYLVTFQGYEVCADYARHLGLEKELYHCLYDVVEQSEYPAIAVSEDYKKRIHDEIGIPLNNITTIPPGIPKPHYVAHVNAIHSVQKLFTEFDKHIPLITYLGRCDAEKGIDLLLYAVAILKRKGVAVQLVLCGPTMYGGVYSQACKEISDRLRIPVFWSESVSDEIRTDLYVASSCIVYPSIQREPFGMVPVEAMSLGTPVIVPNMGGVADVIESDEFCGGIRFKSCDTNSLADALEKIICDHELHRKLSEDGPKVAEYYTVEKLADRVLQHLGLSE